MTRYVFAILCSLILILGSAESRASTFSMEDLKQHLENVSETEKQSTIDQLKKLIAEQELQAQADPGPAQENGTSFFEKIVVRKSAYDKNSIGKPGSLQYTNPSDGKSSYAINIGVSIAAIESERFLFAPKIEYHRNTEINNEQDTLLAGIVGAFLIGSVVSDPNKEDLDSPLKNTWAFWADGKLDYKKDDVKSTKSWQVSEMFTPLNSDFGLGGPLWFFNGSLPTRFDLAAGVEYEDIFDSKNGKDGSVFRGTVRGGIITYPAFSQIGNRLQFGISGQYWNEWNASGNFRDGKDTFDNFQIYLNYYFDDDENIGLGVSYLDGDNPSKGLVDQKYTQIGLLIKTGG